ncbi:uncharacterized protein METZ01_LOCUS437211, partial [marine metagenome]
MRSIIVVLLLIYSSLSLAKEADQAYYCDINAIQTKDFSEDMLGYEQSDYDKVFPDWLKKAKNGDKKYQFYVAKAYYFGQGVAKNKKRSLQWYTKSSDQGYPVAKNNLSFFYSDGEIVDQDLEIYFKLLCEAATAGLSISTSNIAHFYYEKDNDKNRSFEWTMKAARQGNAFAQNSLGIMYSYGYGISLDYKEAFKWFKKSADQGNA